MGIEPGTSSTRGKCLTTELPRFPKVSLWMIYLQVYQGYADGIEMGRMCGSEAPVMMTSQGTVLSMRFQSNHMKSGSGFLATFSTTLRASGKAVFLCKISFLCKEVTNRELL